jgi:hypothetical protein
MDQDVDGSIAKERSIDDVNEAASRQWHREQRPVAGPEYPRAVVLGGFVVRPEQQLPDISPMEEGGEMPDPEQMLFQELRVITERTAAVPGNRVRLRDGVGDGHEVAPTIAGAGTARS